MVTFLFWNVCGVASLQERDKASIRPLQPQDRRYQNIQRFLRLTAIRENVDVFVLAESPFEGQSPVPGFGEAKSTLPANLRTKCRLEVYHRPTVAFPAFQTVERAVLYDMIVTKSLLSLRLVIAHLDSPLYASEKTRIRKIEDFARDIRQAEAGDSNPKTIVVGDLNFDPYDDALTDPYCLNAVPTKEIALRKSRQLKNVTLPFLYNPMWAHMTDATQTPPGTYYRKTNDVDCRFWHTPDQVLLRPALLEFWRDEYLTVITQSGKRRLMKTIVGVKRPDRKRFSDHLPLLFRLDLR